MPGMAVRRSTEAQRIGDAGERLVAMRLLAAGWTVLRESPRARCSRCGQPTVSRAELDFVVSQVGHPAWLDLCQECRASP